MIDIEDAPRTIRVLLAVATESLADEIQSMVADEGDIEIVAVVTAIEDLIPTVQNLRPKVVILHVEIDDNWAEYVKQMNALNPEPPIPTPLTPDTLKQYNETLKEWSLTALKIGTLSNSETEDLHQQSMLAGATFHLTTVAINDHFIDMLRILNGQFVSLRCGGRKPKT